MPDLMYVDPGSSSYLVQAIIAGAMAAGFAVKTWWWRIKLFFKKKKNRE